MEETIILTAYIAEYEEGKERFQCHVGNDVNEYVHSNSIADLAEKIEVLKGIIEGNGTEVSIYFINEELAHSNINGSKITCLPIKNWQQKKINVLLQSKKPLVN